MSGKICYAPPPPPSLPNKGFVFGTVFEADCFTVIGFLMSCACLFCVFSSQFRGLICSVWWSRLIVTPLTFVRVFVWKSRNEDALVIAYLRNKFDFWNVYGIINTLGLLHSKNWMHRLYLHFIINIKTIEIIYNLGNKTSLFFHV